MRSLGTIHNSDGIIGYRHPLGLLGTTCELIQVDFGRAKKNNRMIYGVCGLLVDGLNCLPTLVCWIELSSVFRVKVLCCFQSKLDSQDERNRIESNDGKYNSCGFQVCVI